MLALTLVFAIGGPLVGRGTFIGTSIMRAELPWQLSTPSTFQYKLPPVYDTVEIGAPARTLIRETLVNEHRVALWDPFANGGTPLGSQPNTGIFSPLNWPLLLLGVRLGSAWAGLFRLALAAWGTFLLLRRLGLSRFAAWCGGLIYCTSGFIISWNNWPQADLAAWIPLLFFTADRLRERRRALDVAAVAAVVGAMLLEGYPPLLVATFYALGGFLLVRWWEAERAGREGPTIAARVRSGLKPATLVIGGVVLGVALAAFQLVPFLMRVSVYDTSYRATSGERKLPASALLTAVFPWAQGSPAHNGTSFPVDHITNFSLTEQFVFLGAAAVVFVLFAMLVGAPKRVGAGIYWYCVAIVALLLVMLFGADVSPLPNVAGGLKAAVYKVPGVSEIPLHRFIAPLLFFASLLAAFGIEHVVGSDRSILRLNRRLLVRGGILLAFTAFLLIPAVRNEIRMTAWTRRDLYFGGSREVAQRAFILKSTFVPMLIVIATVLLVIFALRGKGNVRRVAIGAIPVLLAIEALLVTTTMFPRVADADYYPETGAIRYLSAHLGHERIAPAGRMLYFGTNAVYGLRSVGGHSFSPPEWRKLINAAGQAENTPTQLRLTGGRLGVVQSPVLDRLAARFWVASPYDRPFGLAVVAPSASGAVTVGNGTTASQVVDPGPLRGVIVNVLGNHRLRGDLDFLDVTVRDPAGRVVATGRRRLISQGVDTSYVVAIPGDRLPSDVPWTVEVAVRSNGRDTASLAATADGKVSLGVVRPQADGLRLVYADEGAVVYRRLTALPRIRWASRSKTVPGPRVRTKKLLTGAVADDTVILSRRGPAGSGRPARVVVTEDSGDQIRAEVKAQGNGYLVVADAIQDDWRATVDGRPVDLRDADHALVAVPVPAGRHVVAVSAAPRGWHAGILVSVIAAIILAVLCAWGLVHRRRSRVLATAAEAELPVPEPDGQGVSAKVDSK